MAQQTSRPSKLGGFALWVVLDLVLRSEKEGGKGRLDPDCGLYAAAISVGPCLSGSLILSHTKERKCALDNNNTKKILVYYYTTVVMYVRTE